MGALEFAPRTDVNESLTMGYKALRAALADQNPLNLETLLSATHQDGNLYCVAPIVTSGASCCDLSLNASMP